MITDKSVIEINTIGDLQKCLEQFPHEWPLQFSTKGGGAIVAEHRQTSAGKDFVAIYNDNGGRLGENPLTDEEYKEKSEWFLSGLASGKKYTSIHGDHRLYWDHGGNNDTCYGSHYDQRVIERMVKDGLLRPDQVEIDRVKRCNG